MAISFECTDCKKQYKVRDDKAGKKLRCKCGTINVIPANARTTAGIVVECGACGKRSKVAAEKAGKRMRCKCGEPILVPDSSSPLVVESPDISTVETPSEMPAVGFEVPVVATVEPGEFPSFDTEPDTDADAPLVLQTTDSDSPQTFTAASRRRRKSGNAWLWPSLIGGVLLVGGGAFWALGQRDKEKEPTSANTTSPVANGDVTAAKTKSPKKEASNSQPTDASNQTTIAAAANAENGGKQKSAAGVDGDSSSNTKKKISTAQTAPKPKTVEPQRDNSEQAPSTSPPRKIAKWAVAPLLTIKELPKYRKFDEARQDSLETFQAVQDFYQQIAEADPEARSILEKQFVPRLSAAVALLEAATMLAELPKDAEELRRVQYGLAYAYMLLKNRNCEAGILAENVARNLDPTNELAPEAAYIAFASYVQEYQSVLSGTRYPEMRQLVRIADLMEQSWPKGERNDAIRLTVGQVLQSNQRPMDAARWFARVTPKSKKYMKAQFSAGQAQLTAFVKSNDDQQRSDAIKHLESGIQFFESKKPLPDEAPEELIAAKVTLARIQVQAKQFEVAIKTLTTEPFAVPSAVSVDEGATRPEKGIQSSKFANVAYTALLKSYIGIRDLDQARAVMANLEKVAGDKDKAQLTSLYVSLGKQLMAELKGLDDGERKTQLRETFVGLLASIAERQDSQTVKNLIWISATYSSLGEETSEEKTATAYFQKAAGAFRSILDRAAKDPNLISAATVDSVKVKLAKAQRRYRDHAGAMEIFGQVLVNKKNALTVQIEAAYTLQEWAGNDKDPKKYVNAISGQDVGDAKKAIWGWSKIAVMVARYMQQTGKPEFRDKLLEARLNLSKCRLEIGRLQGGAEKSVTLKQARSELSTFARLKSNQTGPWWDKLDNVYQQIQRELDSSKPPQPLKK